MKRKQGQTDPQIKVITDPTKLAWLRSQIDKQKGVSQARNVLKKIRPK